MKKNIQKLIVIFLLSVTTLFCLDNNPSVTSSTIKNSSLITAGDSLIYNMISHIRADSINSYLKILESFNTRYAYANNKDMVIEWLIAQLQRFGYDNISIDSFATSKNVTCKNIIATLPGNLYPDNLCITSAHYDSYAYSTSYTIAPGADDNGSGVASVLEMARVAKLNNFIPNFTIKFIFFGAEESGLLGSLNLVEKYKQADQKIKIMINQDMIAKSSNSNNKVYVLSYKGFEPFQQQAVTLTEKFTGLNSEMNYDPGLSDSYSFYRFNYPAVYFSEYESNNKFHSVSDSVSYCNISYATRVAQAAYSVLLYTSISPNILADVKSTNIGEGKSIRLKWKKCADPDFRIYKVYMGKNSYKYDSSFTVSDTNIIIDRLDMNSKYYFGVSSVNNSDFESAINETFIIPGIVPSSPKNLLDNPKKDCIVLNWLKNSEEDLLGYNIYRSSDTTKGYLRINKDPVKDTIYTDLEIYDSTYFYFVTALDENIYESYRSSITKSHAVTMNEGILLIQDINPIARNKYNNGQIDSFYVALLASQRIGFYDMMENRNFKLSDLGPYSAIILHSEDNLSLSPQYNIEPIKTYLDMGGNFLFTGYKASAFMPRIAGEYSFDYKVGDFSYDYLNIKHLDYSSAGRISMAVPLQDNYIFLNIDTSKTHKDYLSGLEYIEPTPKGKTIYKSFSKYSTESYTIGSEFIGNKYKTIVLNFPLFFMEIEGAKALMNFIIAHKFNNTSEILDDNISVPLNYFLSQNYPNPFNSVTNITFEIPQYSFIDITVFDILGRKRATLVSGFYKPGRHNVQFDASNLSTGLYIYRMKSDKFTIARKLMYLK